MRIEVAYKYSPYTTANYLVSAFRRMGHEVRTTGPGHPGWLGAFGLIDPAWHPDLFVWVEAGGGYPDWLIVPKVPSIAWLIDGHSQGAWHGEFAKQFTRVFSAQRGDVGTWLPVACDPEVHTPDPGIVPTHDVVFVGHTYGEHPWYSRRRMLLRALAQKYDLCVYEGVYGHDMANAHATGKIVFNVSTRGDVNMRVFEGMCSGRPLVTDEVKGLPFEDGYELFTYTTESELYATVDYMLDHPERSQRMGAEGRTAVLAAHTYDHRASTMLGGIE